MVFFRLVSIPTTTTIIIIIDVMMMMMMTVVAGSSQMTEGQRSTVHWQRCSLNHLKIHHHQNTKNTSKNTEIKLLLSSLIYSTNYLHQHSCHHHNCHHHFDIIIIIIIIIIMNPLCINILQSYNIDIDKISNRLEFGILNRATCHVSQKVGNWGIPEKSIKNVAQRLWPLILRTLQS